VDCFEFSLRVCLTELLRCLVSSGRRAPPKVCYFGRFCHNRVRSSRPRPCLSAYTDQTRRSYQGLHPVTSSEFLSPPFLRRVDPLQLQLLLLCKCTNTTKCTTPCACVLAFHKHFTKGLVTQFTTPLDPCNDAKLDHSSGTRWPICKQVCSS